MATYCRSTAGRAAKFVVIFVFAALVGMSTLDPAWASGENNLGSGGVALHGYDTVAYHTAGKPMKGQARFQVEHGGARYLFVNKANHDAFAADPEKYAPAFGGWCSYGVRVGKKFDIDPHVWKIVNGRLFLQLDPGTQKVWLKDMERNIAIADRIWPSIMAVPAEVLGN